MVKRERKVVIVQFQVVEQTHGKQGTWRKIELDLLGRLAEGVTAQLDLDGWRESESFSDSGSPETITILGTSGVWHVDHSGEGLDLQKHHSAVCMRWEEWCSSSFLSLIYVPTACPFLASKFSHIFWLH